MAAHASLTINGLADVRRALQDLGKRKAAEVGRKAVRAGGAEIKKLEKVLVPKVSRTTERSIAVKLKSYRGVFVAIVGPRTKYGKPVQVGRKTIFRQPSRIAHLLEKGTRRSRARPFAGPAAEAGATRAHQAAEQKAREVLGL